MIGVGVPQATAIADARAARMRHLDETGVYVHVIADGSIGRSSRCLRVSGGSIANVVSRCSSSERPFTSPLNNEKRKGTFACAGCDLPLFSSETKYESGTGWPSFWKPLDNAIGETKDTTFGMTRTEVHCSQCGGHLGHVFDDGPQPTGKRYCMNGVAMKFVPKTA